jgi:hypothetical protein
MCIKAGDFTVKKMSDRAHDPIWMWGAARNVDYWATADNIAYRGGHCWIRMPRYNASVGSARTDSNHGDGVWCEEANGFKCSKLRKSIATLLVSTGGDGSFHNQDVSTIVSG